MDAASALYLDREIHVADDEVVGAALEAHPASNQGSAYVFVKPVAGWSNMTQTAKLLGVLTDDISTV